MNDDEPRIDAALQSQCPVCKATFDAPEIREVPEDFTLLDYLCPACGYQYARWPKGGIVVEGEDDSDA